LTLDGKDALADAGPARLIEPSWVKWPPESTQVMEIFRPRPF
jgi:hypothetical protein